MKGSGRNAQDVTTALQSNDMERLIPGKVDEKKGPTATGRQQIVFLMRMQIELPGTTGRIVGGADRRAAVDHQIARVRGVHSDVEETNRWCVAEALVSQQFKHHTGPPAAQSQ